MKSRKMTGTDSDHKGIKDSTWFSLQQGTQKQKMERWGESEDGKSSSSNRRVRGMLWLQINRESLKWNFEGEREWDGKWMIWIFIWICPSCIASGMMIIGLRRLRKKESGKNRRMSGGGNCREKLRFNLHLHEKPERTREHLTSLFFTSFSLFLDYSRYTIISLLSHFISLFLVSSHFLLVCIKKVLLRSFRWMIHWQK